MRSSSAIPSAPTGRPRARSRWAGPRTSRCASAPPSPSRPASAPFGIRNPLTSQPPALASHQLLNESRLDKKYGAKSSDDSIAKNQRNDLIKGVQRGDDATERLDASVSMAQRTDEIGDDILQSLQEQREKILSARCSAEAMEGDMDISERKMTQMACEKCIQRWVLWVIAALFVSGLLFFLYWKIEIEPEKKRNCVRDESGACESYRRRGHAQLGVDDHQDELVTEAFARGYEEALRRVAKDDGAANLGDDEEGDELATTTTKSTRFGGNRRMLWDADALTYRRYATRGASLW